MTVGMTQVMWQYGGRRFCVSPIFTVGGYVEIAFYCVFWNNHNYVFVF